MENKIETRAAFWETARGNARAAALAAWVAIEPLYRSGCAVTHKPDGPATEADRLADRLIVEQLSKKYPRSEYGYLTEESADSAERLGRERVWIIDPIDGTRDFIKKNGNFAIHIALVERLEDGFYHPVAAAVYLPERGAMVSAVRGGGTLWQERLADGTLGEGSRCRISDRGEIGRMRGLVSNSNRTTRLMRLIQSLGLESYRHVGSLGVKVALIARGEGELYIVTALGMVKEWDACAPQLALEEAGGSMTDLLGRGLHYNRADPRLHRGLIATNGPAHEELSRRAVAFLKLEEGSLRQE